MTDEQLFERACGQIVLFGERDAEGTLTIDGETYEDFPKTIVVQGITFKLMDEEGDHEIEGLTPEDEGQPEQVRAFYDVT